MKKPSPEIIEVNQQQFAQLLARAESNTFTPEDVQLLSHLLECYAHIFEVAGNQSTTIARLRKLLFGPTTEKTADVVSDASADDLVVSDDASPSTENGSGVHDAGEESPGADPAAPSDDEVPAACPGHGRLSADDYPGAPQVQVAHPTLTAGDPCPACSRGNVYAKTPAVLVRFVGQAPLQATVYRLERLRCNLCGETFTAPAPAGVAPEKYDATAASMIGILKYGSGLPFNRLQRLQGDFEIPLAASTQWDIVHGAMPWLTPAYDELIRQAAQGDVVYNDDTTVKILELMKKRAQKHPPEDVEGLGPDRTGLYTSGVVATRDGYRMALFFSGRHHAGENLAKVLRHRVAELTPPIHMCDGLSRNLPGELETILASCCAHARRDFVDLYERFPDECRYVLEAFKVIYHNDQVARDEGMTAEDRLAYHQTHSQQTMHDLQAWLQRQFDEKLVEPNSALGDAINYILKRWDALTLFLRQAGAPLDNNICERALKKAILHRKNSLFYKTRNGARVGDTYMSLIYTCELCGTSAFDYLTQLQRNAEDVAAHPECWLPWNYLEALREKRAAA